MNSIAADTKANKDVYAALVSGRHNDPFGVLGAHRVGAARIVRTLQPHAKSVAIIDASGDVLTAMERVHPGGIFAAFMPPRLRRYRLRITTTAGDAHDIEDPYRFAQTLGDLDLYLLGEGSDKNIYSKLGAQVRTLAISMTGTAAAT
jgi:1,4-alpha-glucan branching enzyme